MKALKDLSDKASDYLDKKGLANPVEVANEAFGGETREESKKRRAINSAGEKGGLEGKAPQTPQAPAKTPKFKSGGSVSSASKRADGCATKGKTRGKMV
jgi:hypothetical protein